MSVAIGGLGLLLLQEGNAVTGQWVGAQILAAVGADPEVLGLEDMEEIEQPLWRHLQRAQIGDGGLVGGLLLRTAELQEAALAHGGAAGHDGRAELRRARHRGGSTQQHARDRADAGIVLRLQAAAEMATGDVPGLVSDHPGQLVRAARAHDETRVDEQVLPAGDEGVQLLVIEDVDVDGFGIELGRGEDRRSNLVDDGFRFSVAYHRGGVGGYRQAQHRREEQHAIAAGQDPELSPHLSSPFIDPTPRLRNSLDRTRRAAQPVSGI